MTFDPILLSGGASWTPTKRYWLRNIGFFGYGSFLRATVKLKRGESTPFIFSSVCIVPGLQALVSLDHYILDTFDIVTLDAPENYKIVLTLEERG